MKIDATVQWNGEAQADSNYSRDHRWSFDGGATLCASSSPDIVPEPGSNPSLVDPEEALVAALASCHMMFFLSLAAREGFTVLSYSDAARGFLSVNAEGRSAITRIILTPKVQYRDASPDAGLEGRLHEQAHSACYIANSIRAEVIVQSRWVLDAVAADYL